MEYPNLYIVGAPKCGTTSLAYWLSTNEQVSMLLTPKEPMFFCSVNFQFSGPDSDALNQMIVRDSRKYCDMVKALPASKYIGEASTDYLSWDGCAERIKAKSANSKIIIVLRDPVDRILSEHSHLIRDGMEDCSLKEALELESQRIENRWNSLFYHKKRSLYSLQVAKYYEFFNKSNVCVLRYETLRDQPDLVEAEICEFLGLDRGRMMPINALKMNVSMQGNMRFLDGILSGRALPGWLRSILKNGLGRDLALRVSSRAREILRGMGGRKGDEVDAQLYNELRDFFFDDICELERLLGVSLSDWKDRYK